MANTTKIQCTCAQKGSDTITASSKEPQCSLPQEGSFEVVEHSDAVGHQCEEASTPLTEMKRKVHELEKKLEVKNEKEKALKSITLVLMWIDMEEVVNDKHEGDSTAGGQAPRLTTAEAHEKADKSFQEFKLWVAQQKNENAVLDDVASFSQLESACFKNCNEGGAKFERTPDDKTACQDKFYLSLGQQRLRTVNKANDKTKVKTVRGELLDFWTEIIPHCKHVIVWHLINDNYALTKKHLGHHLSGSDKWVLARASHIAIKLKHLVSKEKCRGEGITAILEPPTAKPMSPGAPNEQPRAGLQPKGSAILGSNQAYSCGAKSKAAVSNTAASNMKSVTSTTTHRDTIKPQGKTAYYVDDDTDTLTEVKINLLCGFYIKSVTLTTTHKDIIKPQGKTTYYVDDDTDTLTEVEIDLLCGFLILSLAGWLYGGYVAACYIITWVFGLVSHASNR